MAKVNLSLPQRGFKDSAETAALKSYLRILVGELEYILTHLDSRNFVGGIPTDDEEKA